MHNFETQTESKIFLVPLNEFNNDFKEEQCALDKQMCGFSYKDVLECVLFNPDSIYDATSTYDTLTCYYCEDILSEITESGYRERVEAEIASRAMDLIYSVVHGFKQLLLTVKHANYDVDCVNYIHRQIEEDTIFISLETKPKAE
jgi:hypothetical protein